MKNNNFFRILFSMIFGMNLLALPSCKTNLEPSKTAAQKQDTLFVDRMDTIITFDPNTQVEGIRIIKLTDTIIQKK